MKNGLLGLIMMSFAFGVCGNSYAKTVGAEKDTVKAEMNIA